MTLEEYLIEHPKKYLIFDLDGTLAELHINWSTIRQELFALVAQFDKPLIEDVVHEYYSDLRLTNKVIKKYGAWGKDKIDEFRTNYESTNYTGYTPNKELIEFITSDKNKYYHYYMWTSNTTNVVQDFLNKENLNEKFALIVSHNTPALLKPEIEGFTLMHKKNTPLSEYLLIGDSSNDEQAAQKAGIDFFKVDCFAQQ